MDSVFCEYWEALLTGGRKDQVASLKNSPNSIRGQKLPCLYGLSPFMFIHGFHVSGACRGRGVLGPDKPLSEEARKRLLGGLGV